MRTSFNHQSEAQLPNLPARRTGQPQYPIYRKSNPGVSMVQPAEDGTNILLEWPSS